MSSSIGMIIPFPMFVGKSSSHVPVLAAAPRKVAHPGGGGRVPYMGELTSVVYEWKIHGKPDENG